MGTVDIIPREKTRAPFVPIWLLLNVKVLNINIIYRVITFIYQHTLK